MSVCRTGAQRVYAEASMPSADPSRALAAITEVQRDRVGGVSGRQPHRDANHAVALRISTMGARPGAHPRYHVPHQAQTGSRRWRDQRGVVPRELRQRTSAAPAANRYSRSGRRRRSDPGRNTTSIPAGSRCRSRANGATLHRHSLRRERGVRNHAVVEPSPPISVKRRERGAARQWRQRRGRSGRGWKQVARPQQVPHPSGRSSTSARCRSRTSRPLR